VNRYDDSTMTHDVQQRRQQRTMLQDVRRRLCQTM